MSRTVRAAVIEEVGADGFDVADVELDEPKRGEVRIDVSYAGACHTDWHAIDGSLPSQHYPVVGGHEGAGVVREVGPGVERVEAGDHVVTLWIPSCGECEYCVRGLQHLCVEGAKITRGPLLDGTFRFHRDGEDVGQYFLLGTFAEEVVVPEECVVRIPDEMPLAPASIVGCGVVTGYGTAVNRADIEPGDSVAVVGAGNVGLNAIQGAKKCGARRVIAVDPIEFKRETAEAFGATHTVDPTEEDQVDVIREITGGGTHATLFTVGVGDGELIGEAFRTLRPRGELVVTATSPDDHIDVSPLTLMQTEKTVKGCLYGGGSPARSVRRIVEMYLDGEYMLDELITSEYPLDQVTEAYENLLGGEDVHGVLRVED